MIRNIALDESPIERRERMERLAKKSLLLTAVRRINRRPSSKPSEPDSIVILKEGLTSPDLEVQVSIRRMPWPIFGTDRGMPDSGGRRP